jgi:hypothetical protein
VALLLRCPWSSRFQICILSVYLCSRRADLFVHLEILLLTISGAVAYCLALCARLQRLLGICFGVVTACALICGLWSAWWSFHLGFWEVVRSWGWRLERKSGAHTGWGLCWVTSFRGPSICLVLVTVRSLSNWSCHISLWWFSALMVREEEWKLRSIEFFAPLQSSEGSRDQSRRFFKEDSFYFKTVRAKVQCGTKSRTKWVLVFGQIFDSREVSSRNITIHEIFCII